MVQLTNLFTTIKSLGWKLLLPVLGFIAPIKFLLILVGIAIAADTISGVYWAVKRGGWKSFSSRKFRRVANKILVYNLVVISMYAMDIYLLGEIIKLFIGIPLILTKFTAIVLISIEGFSLDETLKANNDNRGVWYHVKRLIGAAKSVKTEAEELKEDK
jgi:hypothetical protein